ncbi:helix-turn-helix transcriptional regulator [Streptococcus parauberis]|uniref:Helix-turn-helix transcriptional regulator n=1 Tax=Streptococcus parauberis TaxID=1348 RepID=A0AAE4HX75_9STRE|nr:helix-turn-helix transcriptional regulator [Streptococcus parauberis]MDT2731543.1 helix-turn-helix transcriptional regulator [Streptococcus parauberis]
MLPERLKELRKNANLTQKKIAEDLNISQQAYQIWESGKRKAGQETLQMFSNYFNVSIDYLLGKSDFKKPDEVDLSDFEILFRKTSKKLSDSEQKELEEDLKRLLLERQKLIDEKLKENNQ